MKKWKKLKQVYFPGLSKVNTRIQRFVHNIKLVVKLSRSRNMVPCKHRVYLEVYKHTLHIRWELILHLNKGEESLTCFFNKKVCSVYSDIGVLRLRIATQWTDPCWPDRCNAPRASLQECETQAATRASSLWDCTLAQCSHTTTLSVCVSNSPIIDKYTQINYFDDW